MSVFIPYHFSQTFYFVWYKMIYCESNPYTAEMCYKFGSLLDRLGAVLLGLIRSSSATCADYCSASFAQGSSYASPCAASRTRHDCDTPMKGILIWGPFKKCVFVSCHSIPPLLLFLNDMR